MEYKYLEVHQNDKLVHISTGAHDEGDTMQAIAKLQHEVRPTIVSIELLKGIVRPKIAISTIYYELHLN